MSPQQAIKNCMPKRYCNAKYRSPWICATLILRSNIAGWESPFSIRKCSTSNYMLMNHIQEFAVFNWQSFMQYIYIVILHIYWYCDNISGPKYPYVFHKPLSPKTCLMMSSASHRYNNKTSITFSTWVPTLEGFGTWIWKRGSSFSCILMITKCWVINVNMTIDEGAFPHPFYK